MRTTFSSKLDEWRFLEPTHSRAIENDLKEVQEIQLALSAKKREIFALWPQTKTKVLTQLRFCATFLERNGDKSELAAAAIRNADNVLFWT
jgi:hypothetical protein